MTHMLDADHVYLDLCDRKVRIKADMKVIIGKKEVVFRIFPKEQSPKPSEFQRLWANRFGQRTQLKPLNTEIILTRWRGQLLAVINGMQSNCNAYHVPYELYPLIRTALK